MDCPHCHAPLSDAAAALCPGCGVDLVKLKARNLLAKLKQASAPAAEKAPPWMRSVLFLGALGVGACLLLTGAVMLARRRAPAAPVAVEEAPPAEATASAVPAEPEPVVEAAPPPPPAAPPRRSGGPDRPQNPSQHYTLSSHPDGTWDGPPVVLQPAGSH